MPELHGDAENPGLHLVEGACSSGQWPWLRLRVARTSGGVEIFLDVICTFTGHARLLGGWCAVNTSLSSLALALVLVLAGVPLVPVPVLGHDRPTIILRPTEVHRWEEAVASGLVSRQGWRHWPGGQGRFGEVSSVRSARGWSLVVQACA